MSIRQEQLDYDPFAAPIPGQSFTQEPGLRPYERPALTANPEQLADALEQAITDEEAKPKILDLLDVGVSAETVAEALMSKCFAEGACTPDVAELAKPYIFMAVVEMGLENNIEDIQLFNDPEEDDEVTMNPMQKLNVMKQANPDKYMQRLNATTEEPLDDDMTEDDMYRMAAGVPAEEGSFLDMEMDAVDTDVPESNEPVEEQGEV